MKVSDLGLQKGYSYLSTLFPLCSIDLIHTDTMSCDVSMDWLIYYSCNSQSHIGSHVTNWCLLHILIYKKKMPRD